MRLTLIPGLTSGRVATWWQRCATALVLLLATHAWGSPEPRVFTQPPPRPGIWAAAASGDIAGIDAALAAGVAVDALDAPGHPKEKSALGWALKARQHAALRHLLERGANPNLSIEGWLPLQWAYLHSLEHNGQGTRLDPRALSLLLEHGADINLRTEWMGSVLHVAVSTHPPDPEAVRFLISHGAQVNARKARRCETPLSELLSQAVGDRPGPAAALETARLLLEAGADPNLTLDTGVRFGAGDAGGISHNTPLIHAARGLGGDYAGYRRLQMLLLLQHGANPRVGGIGGPHEAYPAGCEPTDHGGSAAAEWVGVSGSHANPALTELLGITAAQPALFAAVLDAAGAIQPGEIGYPAIHQQITAKARGGYPVHDEQAVERLLDLGAAVNPEWVLLDPELGWNGYWRTGSGPRSVGLETLPLYADWLSDRVYRRLLQAGAEPGIARDGHMGTRQDSVVVHLIKQQAAGKLALVREFPGLLAKIPPWCGRTVSDIVRALADGANSQRGLFEARAGVTAGWESQTMTEGRHLVLQLLDNPSCRASPDEMATTLETARRLRDPLILAALEQHPQWRSAPASADRGIRR